MGDGFARCAGLFARHSTGSAAGGDGCRAPQQPARPHHDERHHRGLHRAQLCVRHPAHLSLQLKAAHAAERRQQHGGALHHAHPHPHDGANGEHCTAHPQFNASMCYGRIISNAHAQRVYPRSSSSSSTACAMRSFRSLPSSACRWASSSAARWWWKRCSPGRASDL